MRDHYWDNENLLKALEIIFINIYLLYYLILLFNLFFNTIYVNLILLVQ